MSGFEGSESKRLKDEERAAIARYFDVRYYLATHLDVAAAGLDPVQHFATTGWREGRNPNAAFDVNFYLATHPDVAAAGINPFLHFILAGEREGRWPRRPLDVYRSQLERASPAWKQSLEWAGGADRSWPMTSAELTSIVVSTKDSGLVLSFSHDDYTKNFGGVQNVIGDEQQAFARGGWSYLHISPAAPLPMLAEPIPADSFRIVLRYNGRRIGLSTVSALKSAISSTRGKKSIEVVVHHLMGHAPEHVIELATAAEVTRVVVWVHDYFAICTSPTLMRNNIAFCNAPPASSNACTICCFGDEKQRHETRLKSFFRFLRPIVLAPSSVALEMWQRSHLPHLDAQVVPLARLVTAPSRGATADTRVVRVAYLGAGVLHKGWPVFEELARQFGRDERYKFFHLGIGDNIPSDLIQKIPIRVDIMHPNAMLDAVAEYNIDLAVIWPLWPETFSFTTYEALAGGAYIVTNSRSGNVSATIRDNSMDQGRSLESTSELHALFKGTELRQYILRRQKRRGVVIMTGATANWQFQGRGRVAWAQRFARQTERSSLDE